MSLAIGTYDAEIISTSLGSTNSGSAYVAVLCRVDDDQINAKIWLTDKAMGMAKKSLKMCGFNTESEDLADLRDDPYKLAGNKTRIEITEDPKYGLQANILLSELSDAKLKKLTQSLRKAGGKDASGKKSDAPPGTDEPGGDNIPF